MSEDFEFWLKIISPVLDNPRCNIYSSWEEIPDHIVGDFIYLATRNVIKMAAMCIHG